MLNIFSWVFWPFVSSIKNICYTFFANFKIEMFVFSLRCMNDLYLQNTSCLCFANIFSQMMSCLFIFFTGSFDEHKFVIVMKSTVSIFLLWFLPSVSCIRKLAYAQVLYFLHMSIFNCVITLVRFILLLSKGNCWATHIWLFSSPLSLSSPAWPPHCGRAVAEPRLVLAGWEYFFFLRPHRPLPTPIPLSQLSTDLTRY